MTYFHGEIEGLIGNPADDELQAFQAGVGYALGPGIDVSANLLYAEWEPEVGGDIDRDGLVGVVGITLSF